MISIKKLGFGQFGSVYLVKSRQDSNKYALKIIQKQQIIEQQLEKHLLQEKKYQKLPNFHSQCNLQEPLKIIIIYIFSSNIFKDQNYLMQQENQVYQLYRILNFTLALYYYVLNIYIQILLYIEIQNPKIL
ncbi:hypothetical protein IMG5_089030 [Ichthyophthirius multifiliis]|uniref:Protein kinase domain-containing protein n=1 Tax=Ichthyophthirius multifiliis TaxID=5932 RepID=G0QR58_ICHMU|nr:hypothetical protein IMG5_089030 [Ichthyophthirius multifiliis]EGR32298.1 hypothetical protein IMG5_089030 [Ichthyophthirius multifiliis]|eukprot:XP_004035784.1 hypothetical protein IMG5_089030 [Ichthyophthirius multifiliis]